VDSKSSHVLEMLGQQIGVIAVVIENIFDAKLIL
jgi:hypothetical protein